MKKSLTLIVAAIAISACGGGSSDGGIPSPGAGNSSVPPAEDAKVGKACEVVLYGDSIMRGEPLILQGPHRRIQAARPSWTVDLRAVAGQTGHHGARLNLNDPRPTPAVVVMQWGINDAIQRTDVSPIRLLIEKVRAEGSRPVLTGPSPWAGDVARWHAVHTAIQAMAAETETPWVNWGAAPLRTIDGLHPDQDSTNRLVDALIGVLDVECDAASG